MARKLNLLENRLKENSIYAFGSSDTSLKWKICLMQTETEVTTEKLVRMPTTEGENVTLSGASPSFFLTRN